MSEKGLPVVNTGILGGTGLYQIDGLREAREISLETPFGQPSDSYIVGELEGVMVAFLSRHGRGHRYLPSEVNYRANFYGFKLLGVKRVISVNSVGSLKEEIKPRDIVLADQFIDRTRRPNTFLVRDWWLISVWLIQSVRYYRNIFTTWLRSLACQFIRLEPMSALKGRLFQLKPNQKFTASSELMSSA